MNRTAKRGNAAQEELASFYEQLYRQFQLRTSISPELHLRDKDGFLIYEKYIRNYFKKIYIEEECATLSQISEAFIESKIQLKKELSKNLDLTETNYEIRKLINIKILRLFYCFIFFETYLYVPEDSRKKITKVINSKASNKHFKQTCFLYRDVLFLALCEELSFLCTKTKKEDKLSRVLPIVKGRESLHTTVRELYKNEVESNIRCNLKNKNATDPPVDFKSIIIENKLLLADVMSFNLFSTMLSEREDVDHEDSLNRTIQEVRIRLQKQGVYFIKVGDKGLQIGSEKDYETLKFKKNIILLNSKIKNLKPLKNKKIQIDINNKGNITCLDYNRIENSCNKLFNRLRIDDSITFYSKA